MTRTLMCLTAALFLTSAVSPQEGPQAQGEDEIGTWPYYGGNLAFQRYSSLDQIGPENVNDLRIVWSRPGVDPDLTRGFDRLRAGRYLRATPIFVDGVLYAPNAVGLVEAFDPGTGETVWIQEPPERTIEGLSGRTTRGLATWVDDAARRRILSVRGEYLYALNAADGTVISDFGIDGRVNLTHRGARRYSWSSGPIVVEDVIVIGGTADGAGDSGNTHEAIPEDIRGYDVRTGELLWTFHVVPAGGEFGNDTWEEDSWRQAGDLGSWCCLSADEALGYVYVPLSAPTSARYGGHRRGDNLFSNSLVALDARTGERIWHFQMVHHDVWEYDNMGPPILGDITVDGRRVPAVMQPNKNGFLYVFDRVTGEPVWPIEEKPVPGSDVPGEYVSPTQPFPSKPPAFDRQGVSMDDLVDFTPEIRGRAREAVEGLRLGPLYTPPTHVTGEPGTPRGTLTIPGGWGAANWNTGAFDPETGT